MKQLDVVVSPPAFVWDPYFRLTNVTFGPDPCDLWPWYLWSLISRSRSEMISSMYHHTKFEPPKSNGSRDMNFYLVNFYLMNYFLVRQMDRQKAMHNSPPCTGTGGLKNNIKECPSIDKPPVSYIPQSLCNFAQKFIMWCHMTSYRDVTSCCDVT